MKSRAWPSLLALFALGCGTDPRDGAELGEVRQAVKAPLPSAFCQVLVEGKGEKSMEEDYLPSVVTCENGGADVEALKAQAIAARSVAYYNMSTKGSICDSQGCQVYSCGAAASDKAKAAVAATSGLYLSYDALLTYGFYVAGDKSPPGPECKGSGTSSTEHWITYNEGKTGADVQMTELGYIPPNQPIFGQNRGCMGQWSARCLESSRGYDYQQILRFFYGADIEILQASGDCITPVNRPPEGYLDDAGCESIRGWAYDPDKPDVALDVMIFVDEDPSDPNSTATFLTADQHRDDLCSAIGSCSHGFELPTPAALLDGEAHSVFAVAVDADGAPMQVLSSSPKTLECSGAGGSAGGSSKLPGSGGAGTSSANQTEVLEGESGCGCRAAGDAPRPSGWWLLGGLGLYLVRRRR